MQRDEMIKISLLNSTEAEAKIDALTTEQLKAFVSSDAPNPNKKRYAQFVLDRRLEKEATEQRHIEAETEERRHQETVGVAQDANRLAKWALVISILGGIGTIVMAIFKD